MTSIEFDLDLHLYQDHRMELVQLPIDKGSIDARIAYAIEEGKTVGRNLQILSKVAKDNLEFKSTPYWKIWVICRTITFLTISILR
jgi:hypothetical protein